MNLLLVLAAVIIATKLLGELAQRFGRPAVLGELVAGVLLGTSVLGVFDPADPVLASLAQIGVLVLIFQIGLSTDLRSLRAHAGPALMVAVTGVALPFIGSYFVARAFGLPPVAVMVVAAAMTPTSVGIAARVLSDVDRLHSPEGQIVLFASVFDDIIGLVIFSVLSGVIAGGAVTALGVGRTAGVAVGFVAVAVVLGSVAIPPLFRVVERIRATGALGLIALAFALGLAWLAEATGSALIIGAFAAGLILHPTPERREIESSMTALGHFFVPMFFAGVGASVNVHALASSPALLLGGALLLVGAIGKVVAGYAPWWLEGNKLVIGTAMLPRGEVELIIAQMGIKSGVISQEVFGAIMLVVAATSLLAPLLIQRAAHAGRRHRVAQTGDHGIDELVAGSRPQHRRTTPVTRRHTIE
ncbi:MAG: cation:proton antiporter [Gemmatimonadales bacterium]